MSEYFECDSGDARYDGAKGVVGREADHIKAWRGRDPSNGLALSGGGIRSASFCLGVLQALAYKEVLPWFDYLSTVSGGGYIGASLTYLLNGKPQAGGNLPVLDASKDNFPYLSFPLVGQPASQHSRSNEDRWKGRLVRRLRESTRYLTPGGGLNGLSLLGMWLRSFLASFVVHIALLVVVILGLIRIGLLDKPSANYSIDWPLALGGRGKLLEDAGFFLLAFAVVSLAYVLLTTFFDLIERVSDTFPYRLRRLYDRSASLLLALAFAAALVGSIPVVQFLLMETEFSLASLNAQLSLVTGLATFASGLLGVFWGSVRADDARSRTIPTTVIVSLASLLLLFGLFLVLYDVLIARNVYTWHREILAGAALTFLVFGWFPDLNYVSLHRFYRDRLMELFMPDPASVWASVDDEAALGRTQRVSRSLPADATLLGRLCGADPDAPSPTQASAEEMRRRGPYHIINANAVLVASRHPRYSARGGDNYILSPLYSGSRATGWRRTDATPQNGFTLATAMAASAAAISPNAATAGKGIARNGLLSVLMGLLNLRLGFWATNPYWQGRVFYSWLASVLVKPNLIYPGLVETIGRWNLHEQSRYVLLTDGGHFENLGLYELVRRRLKVIVVCDADCDPDFKFDDLANAMEKVRSDFGTRIEISAANLPDDANSSKARGAHGSLARDGYLIGKIHYSRPHSDITESACDDSAEDCGTLIYIKPVVTSKMSADLHAYRRAHRAFPHEPTSDQFFDEAQFEAYRELGFQTTYNMLEKEPSISQRLAAAPPAADAPSPLLAALVAIMEP